MFELQEIIPFLKGAPPRVQTVRSDEGYTYPYSREDKDVIDLLASRANPEESTEPGSMVSRLLEALVPSETPIPGLAELTPERCQAIFNTIFAMAAGVEADSEIHFALIKVCADLQQRGGAWAGTPSTAQAFRTILDFDAPGHTENEYYWAPDQRLRIIRFAARLRSFKFNGSLVNCDAGCHRMISDCLRTLPIRTSSEVIITRWVHDVEAACTWLTECGTEVLAYIKTRSGRSPTTVDFNTDPRKDFDCSLACLWMPCLEYSGNMVIDQGSWDSWKQRLRQYASYEEGGNHWDGKGMLRRGAFLSVKASVTRTLAVMEAAEGILQPT